ncbi:uncharacterized protein V6R79_007498 [Siganus canaliculatus]
MLFSVLCLTDSGAFRCSSVCPQWCVQVQLCLSTVVRSGAAVSASTVVRSGATLSVHGGAFRCSSQCVYSGAFRCSCQPVHSGAFRYSCQPVHSGAFRCSCQSVHSVAVVPGYSEVTDFKGLVDSGLRTPTGPERTSARPCCVHRRFL